MAPRRGEACLARTRTPPPARILLMAALILALLPACAPRRPPAPSPPSPTAPTEPSPADPGFPMEGPVSSVWSALETAKAVLDTHPDDPEILRSAARAALWLLEYDPEIPRPEARELAGRAAGWARRLLESEPDSGELAFLTGALTGLRVELARIPNLAEVSRVAELFRRAVELAPSHQQGAPLRALGTLLVRAPQWPLGIGDLDEALELLEQAVRLHPEHPANHLYRAQALREDDRPGEARAALQEVLRLCPAGDPSVPRRHYRQVAEELLAELN